MALGALTVAPVQVVSGLGLAGTVRPDGRLSVIEMPVTARARGLITVIRRRERSPGLMIAGVKDLVAPRFAPADRLVVVGRVLEMPWFEATAPTGTVFWTVPAVTRVTLTLTVHWAPAARMAPVRVRLAPPGVAVARPPAQVVERLGAPAMTMPLARPPGKPVVVK